MTTLIDDNRSDGREQRFIAQVRQALGVSAATAGRRRASLFDQRNRPAGEALLQAARNRSPAQREVLLTLLQERAQPLNLKIHPQPGYGAAAAAIGRLVTGKAPEWGTAKSVVAWDHERVRRLDLPQVLAPGGVPVAFAPGRDADEAARAAFRRQVTGAFVGVTTADWCVADTATLAMKTRPGQARSVSLVPSIHVAVVAIDQLLADLRELYAHLKWNPDEKSEGLTNCLSLISGPSKTADIELVMVHGAHGPRELHLFVVKDSSSQD